MLLHSGLRILQAVLLGTCAYLVYAAIAPAIGAAPAAPARIPEIEERETGKRPWSHYQIIGQRDLFRSASSAPQVREPAEKIAESKLRMKLHATITGEQSSLATLEDLSTHERFYVRPGDPVGTATVEWIERRKVVIQNQGKREAITMDEETVASAPPKTRSRRVSSRTRTARAQAQSGRARLLNRLSRRTPRPAAALAPAAGGPSLLRQATFSPAIDELGQVEGLLVQNVDRESPLGETGLPDGSVCLSLNGVRLTDRESVEPATRASPGQQNCLVCRDPLGNEQSYCLQ